MLTKWELKFKKNLMHDLMTMCKVDPPDPHVVKRSTVLEYLGFAHHNLGAIFTCHCLDQ